MSDELMELPEGWEWVKLSDVAEKVGSGATPRGGSESYKLSGIPLIRSMNVHFDGLKLNGLAYLDDKQANELKNVEVKANDVLLNITGASIGRVTQAPPNMEGARVNQHVCIIRTNPILDTNFLSKYLASPIVQRWIMAEEYGATRQALTKQMVLDFSIPLPPLNEQKRIVATIAALRDRTQKAREALEAIPALCDKFRQSVLAAAFRGDLTADWREQNPDVEPASVLLDRIRREKVAALGNYKEPDLIYEEDLPELPDTWTWVVPEALTTYESNAICAGPFGTIFKAKDFRDEGIPIIFLRHVTPEKYLTHKPGFMNTEKWEELFTPYSVWGGELLITKLGEPPGACAIYPEGIGPAMVTPDVIKMTVNRNSTESLYLMHYFNSELSKKITFGVAYGVTRLRMNLTIFRSLPVPLAPLEEQKEACKIIQKFFQIVDYVEQHYLDIENQLNYLDRSILAKAFRGELVEQDPNDEPASILLERIRAEREKLAGEKKGKGKRATSKGHKASPKGNSTQQMTLLPEAE